MFVTSQRASMKQPKAHVVRGRRNLLKEEEIEDAMHGSPSTCEWHMKQVSLKEFTPGEAVLSFLRVICTRAAARRQNSSPADLPRASIRNCRRIRLVELCIVE
jgi:hypothetical protein